MCCEECTKYEKCVEEDNLKDNCCKKCPEYDDCVGNNSREDIPYDGDSEFYND